MKTLRSREGSAAALPDLRQAAERERQHEQPTEERRRLNRAGADHGNGRRGETEPGRDERERHGDLLRLGGRRIRHARETSTIVDVF